MGFWNTFDESKWKILSEIGNGNKTMAGIAGKIGTSVANVGQQLKLLEAYEVLEKEKKITGKAGKPSFAYSVKKDSAHLLSLTKNGVLKKNLDLKDPHVQILNNALLLEKGDDAYFVAKFLLEHGDLVTKCKAVCFISSNDEMYEFLLITDKLDEVRKEFSNLTLVCRKGIEKKIVCWTHNEGEIENGLKNKDQHFLHLLKNSRRIYDPKNVMRWSLD